DVKEKILFQIIDTFPTDLNKKDFGHMMLSACLKAIDHMDQNIILSINTKKLRSDVDKLLQSTEIYGSEIKLWKPGVQ
ncbi:MAG: hypothetical protein KKD78_15620, partial [Proteobacteria bacterium]|nr:hypothetical protein [Pseudomonadota bacterium]